MNRRSVPIGAVVCALVLFPCAAFGQQTEVPKDAVRLSLEECMRIALENNLDLVAARKDPLIAEENVKIQDAPFDPELSIVPSLQKFKREPRAVFEVAGRGETINLNATATQQLKYGANYSVGIDTNRQDGANVPFEPFYQTQLNLVFTQPLLRGLGKKTTAEQLLLARGSLEMSREELRRQAHSTLELVEGAYWNVKAARAALGVAVRKLGRAEKLLELNEKKVEVGTLAPIEITQAKAGVASNEEDVIVAETTLENNEDELLRLMAVPQTDPMWARPVVAVNQPSFSFPEVDLDETIATALARRPELQQVRHDLQNKELSVRAAKNRVRPGLDLRLSGQPFGNNNEGVAPPGPDGIFGTADDNAFNSSDYSDSVSEISKFNNYGWDARIIFSLPIRNRAAKGRYQTAILNREKSEIGVTNQEQTIRVEVRRAVREVESGKKRVAAARSNVELQGEKLEAEEKKFDNGMSTSFEVLTFQNDLADAELSQIRALVDFNKAIVALERSKGTLLEARGLRLEP